MSPDAGGVHRAKKFRDNLKNAGVDAGLAMIIKVCNIQYLIRDFMCLYIDVKVVNLCFVFIDWF